VAHKLQGCERLAVLSNVALQSFVQRELDGDVSNPKQGGQQPTAQTSRT